MTASPVDSLSSLAYLTDESSSNLDNLLSQPPAHSDSLGPTTDRDEAERRERENSLARNRQAATKCRQRKRQFTKQLEDQYEEMSRKKVVAGDRVRAAPEGGPRAEERAAAALAISKHGEEDIDKVNIILIAYLVELRRKMAAMAVENKKTISSSCTTSSSRNKEILKPAQAYLISGPSIKTNFNPTIAWELNILRYQPSIWTFPLKIAHGGSAQPVELIHSIEVTYARLPGFFRSPRAQHSPQAAQGVLGSTHASIHTVIITPDHLTPSGPYLPPSWNWDPGCQDVADKQWYKKYLNEQTYCRFTGLDTAYLTQILKNTRNCQTLILDDRYWPWGAAHIKRETGCYPSSNARSDYSKTFFKQVVHVLIAAMTASGIPVLDLAITTQLERIHVQPSILHFPTPYLNHASWDTALASLQLTVDPGYGQEPIAWSKPLADFIMLFPRLDCLDLYFDTRVEQPAFHAL
ncbi:bZIP transcription factor [Aspergillus affinis]|uniref:bZIP transcription factor n=1 Tax=Aspergillus affinis TaxID=1070780 RepID=UPI0022FEFE25|nr:uncharacterized protein KD926_004466 [Aspergillus affinis]KAI9035150.1 hypothetical protein KD926_004466 [Aspergillus affinis]